MNSRIFSIKYALYIIIAGTLLSMQSCFTSKNYIRPEKEVVQEKYFRTDQINQDSLSMANLSWRSVFTDDKLSKYIDQALTNNMDIRIAIQNINVAEAYVKQGKASFLPFISGNASYTYINPSLNGSSGINLTERTNINQYELSAGLSWEADIWGKIRSNYRAANASYLQSITAHQTVKSKIIESLASIYYQLMALDKQQQITTSTVQLRESSLQTIQALKESGQVSEVAVQQTQAQLYNAQSLLLDIENNIKSLENTFCILLGEYPHAVSRNQLNQQRIDTVFHTGVPAQLLSNRPDVMAAEYGLIQAFELTNVARSNFYPALRLTANGGIQSLQFNDLFNVNSLFASLIGSLTQPIFNGRQIRTQYEVRQAQQEIALLNYKKAVMIASQEVSDALYAFQTNDKKINLKLKEYSSYQKAAEDSEELLVNGYANYLEVLTAQQNALNAQLSVVNAELNRLISIAQLYAAVGGGWR